MRIFNFKFSIFKKVNLMWIFVGATPLFLVVLYYTRYLPQLQLKVLLIASLFYLALAFMYHQKDKTLTFEIIIEYILIAALALVIVQGIFF